MNLATFISDTSRRDALAAACNTHPGYLWQLATGWQGRRPSTDMAQAIERESARIGPEVVPKESLRPDVWSPTTLKRANEGRRNAA